MLKTNDVNFYLNEKEGKAMIALWASDRPLSAAEIAKAIDEEWASKSIQNIIRTLEAKNAIEVTGVTKKGKTYGRLFRPTVSSEEYALCQFNKFYNKNKDISHILSAFVSVSDDVKPEFAKKIREFTDSLTEEL